MVLLVLVADCCGAAASVYGALCNCDARRHVRHTSCGYAHSHRVGRHRVLCKGSMEGFRMIASHTQIRGGQNKIVRRGTGELGLCSSDPSFVA